MTEMVDVNFVFVCARVCVCRNKIALYAAVRHRLL